MICLPVSAVPDYRQILLSADKARGNVNGVTWEVLITSYQKKKKKTNVVALKIKARGFDVLAENTAPPKYKGNKVLMLNGNMWFYRPNLSKPVPISKRQKLLGQAAYGDITSTDYTNRYKATLIGNEQINGENCYLFKLESKSKDNTYDIIKYWISKQRLVGIKAEYYTVSEKLFKSATMQYENHIMLNNKRQTFISRINIRDELLTKDETILKFSNTRLKKLDDYIFNLNLLRK